MFALLSPRLWLAVALAVALGLSHGFAYKTGKAAVRADWDRDVAERTELALKASEAARAKEKALQSDVDRIRTNYAKEAARAKADHTAALDDLDSLLHAIGTTRATGTDTGPAIGTDDAARARYVFGQCAQSITAMAEVCDAVETRLTGLQEYVNSVLPKLK